MKTRTYLCRLAKSIKKILKWAKPKDAKPKSKKAKYPPENIYPLY